MEDKRTGKEYFFHIYITVDDDEIGIDGTFNTNDFPTVQDAYSGLVGAVRKAYQLEDKSTDGMRVTSFTVIPNEL